jgi:uncharacterized protein YjbJ (UPF0337 family)
MPRRFFPRPSCQRRRHPRDRGSPPLANRVGTAQAEAHSLPCAAGRQPHHLFHKEVKMGELIDKGKGKIKQAVGHLTGNKGLEREGEADELKGKPKGAVEEVKGAVKDAKQAIKQAAE